MVALLTMIVVMMIAFTTNLGKLVTERIAIQNTADLSAYSAAATQAGVLNDIRRHNQRIWQAHSNARKMLEKTETAPVFGFEVPCATCIAGPQGCPQKITNMGATAFIGGVRSFVQIESGIIEGLNQGMGNRAKGAAEAAAAQNYPGTTVTAKGGSTQKADLDQDEIDLDYYGWGFVSSSYPCPYGAPVGSMQITHTTVPSWFFKNPQANGEVMFAVEVRGTPANKFLGTSGGTYLGNYFGDRRELKAYAAALPMAGKVGTIKDGDFTRAKERMWSGGGSSFINDSIEMGPGHADTSAVLDESEVVVGNGRGGNYHDYKARYVGIFEGKAQFPNGQRLSSAFGGDGSKIAH